MVYSWGSVLHRAQPEPEPPVFLMEIWHRRFLWKVKGLIGMRGGKGGREEEIHGVFGNRLDGRKVR